MATAYKYMKDPNGVKIQVDSAIRDGNGAKIDTTYQTKLTFDSAPTASSTNPVTSGGVKTALDGKQATLVSGTNIKTVNGISLLGSGNISTVASADDYIILRDGATSALTAGTYAGVQVKKYDGTNDGRLVIDSSGTAKVGNVGDEQPLTTRDETYLMNANALTYWDRPAFKIRTLDNGSAGQFLISNGYDAPSWQDGPFTSTNLLLEEN